MPSITILFAMQDEAQPFIEHYNLSAVPDLIPQPLPMQGYSGTFKNLNLFVVVSGKDKRYNVDNIGCEPATLMAYEAVRQTNPDILVSAGAAGGFAKLGAEIGTVYLNGDYFIFHDRHVPMGDFHHAAIGRYPGFNTEEIAKKLRLKRGVMSTGSSLKKSDSDLDFIIEHDGVSKDMESAAIAWVADMFEIPLIGMRSITNLVDEENDSEEEFAKNFDVTIKSLQSSLEQLIVYLAEK